MSFSYKSSLIRVYDWLLQVYRCHDRWQFSRYARRSVVASIAASDEHVGGLLRSALLDGYISMQKAPRSLPFSC